MGGRQSTAQRCGVRKLRRTNPVDQLPMHCYTMRMMLSREQMVEHMLTSDKAFDGKFIVGVKTTGIFCLPSCHPPRKPKPDNVVFYATPAEARAAGLRTCKLCHPDDFYLGYDMGEALVEKLVAAVALDPGAFPMSARWPPPPVSGRASSTSYFASTITRRQRRSSRGRGSQRHARRCCRLSNRSLPLPSLPASRVSRPSMRIFASIPR